MFKRYGCFLEFYLCNFLNALHETNEGRVVRRQLLYVNVKMRGDGTKFYFFEWRKLNFVCLQQIIFLRNMFMERYRCEQTFWRVGDVTVLGN
jgi:hypothetical protein